MRYLLDTNACIHHLKFPNSPVTHRLRTDLPHTAVCSIVKAELFFGAMQSNDPTATLRQQQTFLSQFVSLPFDDQSTLFYATIRAKHTRSGQLIGAYDLQIAAIALAHDLILISNNTR
jgi:tRNA(fMet)-specific endonuclease VapC